MGLRVLAALEGAAELNAYLDHTLKMTMPQLSERAMSRSVRPEPPGIYVSSIAGRDSAVLARSSLFQFRPGLVLS